MRKKEKRMVISFHTTTEAMAMEEACKKDHMEGRIIPLPTVISAGCGLAWSAPESEGEKILKYMESKGLAYEAAGVYQI